MGQRYKNILVIDLAFIGDVLLATPVMRALKAAYPASKLTLLTVPVTASIARLIPYVDEVIVYDKRGKHKGLPGMFRMADVLKPYNFDLAVCMNFAVRGAVVACLAGIPERLGYDAQHAGWFLTMKASAKREGIKHETLNHLEVLKPLGITTVDTSLELELSTELWDKYRRTRLQLGIPEWGYLAICPLGSYDKKSFSQAAAAHLVRHWNEIGRRVYLIGSFEEGEALETIARMAGLPYMQVLAGKLTLPELAVFLKRADKLVTVDTGPMHIAQAVGCPVVAVFGPTDPVVWGPRGEDDIVLYRNPGCSPCWGKGVCREKNLCMGSVSALEIIKAVEQN